ncbi:MAG: tetratricopeptide repeat protein [Candidatus Omnitrophica bacterium]|nr:tetratricopeptide repeat protein [Candidatus Omnitrophota bacterium]
MRYFFCLIIFVFFQASSVWAAPTLADLQSVVIQGDYKKANDLAQELSKASLSKVEAAEVQYYLGLTFLRLGEPAKAYDIYKKLIASQPHGDLYDKSSVGLIDSLYMQGQYDQALKEAISVIAKRSDSEMMSLFYLKAARANLKLARWAQAREFLKKIIREYPDSFEGPVARQLLEEKQYFTVQVGSFVDKARAETLVQELIGRKQYAYILEIKSSDGKIMYRVRVGQLTALKDARELESTLSGLGYPTLIYP